MVVAFDREDILRTWNTFRQPGEVTELRILNAGWNKTISGYFDDANKFADAVVGLADESYPAYYITINPVNPELMARAANGYVKKAKNTTTDKDIVALHWLPIDLDAQRPAGVSSTDEEHEAAIAKAKEIRAWLIGQGWPASAFVLADSGNGAHLSVRIDLPNDKVNVALVKRCLETLHKRFSDEKIHVDVTTHNPARIWKVYGTMARKGSSTESRPHRLARLMDVPESLEVGPVTLLEALGGLVATPGPEKKKATATKMPGAKRWNQEDISAFVEPHGIHVLGDPKVGADWTVFELDKCPFNPEHNRGEACLSVNNRSGIIAFKCQHDSCRDLKIEDLYELWIPDPLPTGESAELVLEDVCDIEEEEHGSNGNTFTTEKCTFNHSRAVDSIQEKLPIALGEDDMLYYWQGAAWTDQTESIIFNKIRALAGKDFRNPNWKDVLTALRHALNFDRVKFDSNPYLLGVKNGVVDLRKGEFRDYYKEDLISRQIKVEYDPLAACPRFIKFLGEVCPDVTDRLMLIDWLAIHAIGKAFPYVMFLLGLGRNGKGVYEHVLERFFGKTSFSYMGLEEIGKSNFAKANLAGKRGLIVSEAGDNSKKGKGEIPTRFLKLSTGDGTIDGDRKNTTRIQFDPTFKSTIDSNDMPVIKDRSRGWEERFCKADMPYHFLDSPDKDNSYEKKKDPHLSDKLTTHEELSGLLNLIIYRAMEICKTEMIIKRTGKVMVAEYNVQSNSVKTFLDAFCEYDAGVLAQNAAALRDVYAEYEKWCEFPPKDKVVVERFGSAVKKFCNNQSGKKYNGIKRYPGFVFYKDEFKEYMKSSSNPVDPVESSKNPAKSMSDPVDPVNLNIWTHIEKKFGVDSNMINHNTISPSEHSIEENLKKTGFCWIYWRR